ncbi:MAG: ribonuclease PH [Cryobacterium sp.]|nr:ribonuclease PH [Oligoflexia bacterium]
MTDSKRSYDRTASDIRPLTFEVGFTRYAEGSVLVRAGNTHVLCTATIEESVPSWLKGKGQGWITAEYSMLPRSTHTRSRRDREKISGRTQEIQRLIGRALRSCIDLKALGERQVILDCDVLQADGGTRTASITGACVALRIAIGKLAREGKIPLTAFTDTVSAISIGLSKGQALTDLDYEEDSSCDVDMNFVMTGKGGFVEIQGTAEHAAFSRAEMSLMTDSAVAALEKVKALQRDTIAKHG